MKNLNKKKKLFIFDLDGVLIDSKENMRFAWNSVRNKHKINVSFTRYFEKIGKSFQTILKELKIIKSRNEIESTFKKNSLKKINLIKIYPGVRKTIDILKKKRIKIVIVTSKDKLRSKKILKKLKIKINQIYSPSNSLRGKPSPDLILHAIKKNKSSKESSIFIGDTISDQLAAKNAKVDFIFAKYGYKIGLKKSKLFITKFDKLINFLNVS